MLKSPASYSKAELSRAIRLPEFVDLKLRSARGSDSSTPGVIEPVREPGSLQWEMLRVLRGVNA